MQFPNLVSTRFRPLRNHPNSSRSWVGHLPFASDLVDSLRPALLVELGVQYGDSYFGFCQAIKETGTGCTCYAVDTWSGDAHAGFYGDDVFHEVQSYNDEHYKSFSYLMRAPFDQALSHFSSESIDLLHIDGFHTYEAAKHDLEGWLPKVKLGGIVLMHDVAARRADYGVWRLWEEIAARFQTFSFHHSYGLGVIRKAGGCLPDRGVLPSLFDSTVDPQPVRDYYQALANHLDAEFHLYGNSSGDALEPLCQVFFANDAGYSEESTVNTRIRVGAWERVAFDLPGGALKKPVRIDPADCPALISLKDLAIKCPGDGQVVWCTNTIDLASKLTVLGTCLKVPGPGCIQILSYGNDPQILLQVPPELESDLTAPAVLEFSLRLQTELTDLSTLGPQLSSWLAAFEARPPLDAELTRLRGAAAASEHRIIELLQAVTDHDARTGALEGGLRRELETQAQSLRVLERSRTDLEAARSADAIEINRLKARIDELEAELGVVRVENLLQSNELAWLRSQLNRGTERFNPEPATSGSVFERDR
jgi:hypothetical protein